MKRTLRPVAFAALAALTLLLTGCPPKHQRPTPEATVFDQGQRGVDWVDPTTIYGPDAADLSLRSSSFGDEANRIDNLLPDIYFDYNTPAVRASERPKLQDVADYLRDNPGDRLVVEGNCDWRGTRDYNLALGDRRASSVKQYLVDLGIDPARIETLSHGDLNATENAAEATMAQDRRADLIVVR